MVHVFPNCVSVLTNGYCAGRFGRPTNGRMVRIRRRWCGFSTFGKAAKRFAILSCVWDVSCWIRQVMLSGNEWMECVTRARVIAEVRHSHASQDGRGWGVYAAASREVTSDGAPCGCCMDCRHKRSAATTGHIKGHQQPWSQRRWSTRSTWSRLTTFGKALSWWRELKSLLAL